jgi:hypothetical protein
MLDEDINDLDQLRQYPVLGVIVGRPTSKRAIGAVLPGKSALNRLEHAEGALTDLNQSSVSIA